MQQYSLTHVSDASLLRDLAELVARDRAATATLLAHIAEVDARKLYAPAGYSSMFAYCVGELRLSEDAVARRIQAARAGRKFPALLSAVAEGRLHLTGVCLLAPHLTVENAGELLEAATHKRKAEIEELLAQRFGVREIRTVIRALPARRQHAPAHVEGRPLLEGAPTWAEHAPAHVEGGLLLDESLAPVERAPGHVEGGPSLEGSLAEHAPAHVEGGPFLEGSPIPAEHAPAHVESAPLLEGPPTPAEHAPAHVEPPAKRFLVKVTIGADTHEKLRYAQALLSHALPAGDVAQVLDRALDALIRQLETRKFARTSSPRRARASVRKRYISAHVRRAVWERDGGQCTFVGDNGKRCETRTFLEYDHVDPVSRGGQATAEGMRLRCRAHNQLEAERALGVEFMRRKREEGIAARATEEQLRDVLTGLRSLGCRPYDARRAAEFSRTLPCATLEERMRGALQFLGKASSRQHALASRGG